jgi:mRNA interferase YafQ
VLTPHYTGKFRKDFGLMASRQHDMLKLKAGMTLIEAGTPLPAIYKNHPLRGIWKGSLECHIEGDWLLIYEINEAKKTVVFQRTGTHSDLYGK